MLIKFGFLLETRYGSKEKYIKYGSIINGSQSYAWLFFFHVCALGWDFHARFESCTAQGREPLLYYIIIISCWTPPLQIRM